MNSLRPKRLIFQRTRRQGFALYLVFVVTTVLFFLALGSLDMARAAVDMGRSGTLDVVGFHAADGGLEVGLSRLRKNFVPFTMQYVTNPEPHREVLVFLQAEPGKDGITLSSQVDIREGKMCVARRRLVRQGITKELGRGHDGVFMEMPSVGQGKPMTKQGEDHENIPQ
jgi:hypothetical protein